MAKDFNLFGLSALSQAYKFEDKELAKRNYLEYMFMRTLSMFEYDNLPDTMSKRMLELYTQINGHCAIIKHEGKLYSLFGTWGGYPNEYYIPTKYIIANPYLNIGKEYDIGVDCVVFANDSLYKGLLPLYSRYASLLVENDISMRMCDINARIVSLISATDDKTKASAVEYLNDIIKGKLGVIADTAFIEGLKTQPYSTTTQSNSLTDLIEYHQYLRASWFNDIGLQANYNMKRESINSDEAQLNDDMLLPLIDEMLNTRKENVKKINEMFGTDISVRLSSAWEDNRQELEATQKSISSDYSESEEIEDTEESEEIEDTEESEEIEDTEESEEIEDTEESEEIEDTEETENTEVSIEINTNVEIGGADDEQDD